MSKCSLGVADASGSELIAPAAGEPGCAREHAPAAEAGEAVEDE